MTKQIENVAVNMRDRLLIRLPYHLNCSISEALGIEVDDIDFVQGTVTLRYLKVRTNLSCSKCGAKLVKSHAFCPGCGHRVDQMIVKESEHIRVRTLPIDDKTLNMLKEYVDEGGPVLKEGKRLIFGITRIRAWQIARECAVKAGVLKLINPVTGRRKSRRINKTSPVRGGKD